MWPQFAYTWFQGQQIEVIFRPIFPRREWDFESFKKVISGQDVWSWKFKLITNFYPDFVAGLTLILLNIKTTKLKALRGMTGIAWVIGQRDNLLIWHFFITSSEPLFNIFQAARVCVCVCFNLILYFSHKNPTGLASSLLPQAGCQILPTTKNTSHNPQPTHYSSTNTVQHTPPPQPDQSWLNLNPTDPISYHKSTSWRAPDWREQLLVLWKCLKIIYLADSKEVLPHRKILRVLVHFSWN